MNRILLLVVTVICAISLQAQNWLGVSNSNYSGTNGVYLNPASIVDGRMGAYLNISGFGVNMYNNYLGYTGPVSFFKALRSDLQNGDDSTYKPYLNEENIIENLNGKDKVINFSTEVRGPALMISLHKRHAIAITTRNRFLIQAVDVSQPIARMIRWGLDNNTPAFEGPPGEKLAYDEVYRRTRFGINFNNFVEVGFSYATVLIDRKQTFLKAGLTYKYLAGLYSFYIKNDGGNGVTVHSADSMSFFNTNISYGYVNETVYYDWGTKKTTFDPANIFGADRVGKGYGIDLGVTYEFRPKYEDYQYMLDGKKRWDKTENKYLLRVSGTLMDFGKITYKSDKYVRNNTLNKNSTITWGSMDTLKTITQNLDSLPEGQSFFYRVDQAVGGVFGFESTQNEFVSKLPTALNIQADVKLTNNLYANLIWLQGLRRKGEIGARQFSMLALTPRFETRWLEAAIPLVLNNDYRNFAFGLYLRLGPWYLGSDNITGLFKSTNANGMDFYTGLCIPLYKNNPRDRDNDGVSDKRDRCKYVAGAWDFWGCPDTDGDGVEDSKDECDSIPGKPEFAGCPDTDNDGVPDSKDECIYVAGKASYGGCPDTDDDGIEDRKDSCAYLKGLPEFNGCPDTDLDGIEDRKDNCPEVAGKPEMGGCPDSDNDGVRDLDDKCPDEPGKVEYRGCPDTDGDGIPDNQDKCPDAAGDRNFGGCPDTDGDDVPDYKDLCALVPGPPENNGCPTVAEKIEIVELDEEEEKVLREVFDNLLFETGKSIIQSESFASLDELAELLKTKAAYRLYIAGHTDNVGNKKANKQLSEDRANAVKAYLVGKGIDASRIKTEGFGDERPVATNKTPEGRQKNRRVEFKVIK